MSRLILIAMLAGCYDPGAVNCTVSCEGSGACASGQVCGSDGFCAAPEVAGHCSTADNGAGGPAVRLVIAIMGKGKVTVEDIGSCDSEESSGSGPAGQCTFMVPMGVARELEAIEAHDKEFEFWSQGCLGTAHSCMVTPTLASTTVGAKFE
ncbi:MAG: hypothetical protein HOV81_12480 [Kofleriaceae bacterium]|nr:hypothetical protein [Kofleriaceae bacterium]